MTLNSNSKKFLSIASFMMALSIALGAFGAHGLKSILTDSMMKVYTTGVEYQFYNTLGLFIVAFLINFYPTSKKLIRSASRRNSRIDYRIARRPHSGLGPRWG